MTACGVFHLVHPLAITAFGGPEALFSLGIIAFGASELMVPEYYCRVWKMEMKEARLLNLRVLGSYFANPLSPYSIQKRPEPQICPKFVLAIVFGGSSQGDWNLSKIFLNLKNVNCTCLGVPWQTRYRVCVATCWKTSIFRQIWTNVWQISVPPDWNPPKQSPRQISDKFMRTQKGGP